MNNMMTNSMRNNIFVSIIGLSLNTTNQLKSLFLNAVNHQFKITWTNIANNELDLVILNQNFINSPAANNILSKNIPIITVQNDKNKENTIENNQLFLPFSDTLILRKWILNNIKFKTNLTLNNQTDLNLIEKFNTIFHNSHSNYFQCHMNSVQSFVIDKKMHEIWINNDFEYREIQNLDIEVLNFDQFVNYRQQKKKYDLSIWLWDYLWSSLKHTAILNQSTSTYYKLKYWPQLSKNTPKETLKISSCLQYGANISTIEKHLNIQPELISKFISIALACDLIEVIHANDAKFKLNIEDNTHATLRNFFSKMRKKLGI